MSVKYGEAWECDDCGVTCLHAKQVHTHERVRVDPYIRWCLEQRERGRIVVALISPEEAHDGPRYAGFYCENSPT